MYEDDEDKQLNEISTLFGQIVDEKAKNVDYISAAKNSDLFLLGAAISVLSDLHDAMNKDPKIVLPAELRSPFMKMVENLQAGHNARYHS